MSDVQKRYAQAVSKLGANAVSKATGLVRNTVLSIAVGTAREGTMLLAEQRADRLPAIDAPHTTPPEPRAA